MALTSREIHDLNNMNRAAQNVQLGTLLDDLIENGGGGGSGDSSILQKSTYLEFPSIGSENMLYISQNDNTSYRWDNANKKYYVVGFNYDNITGIFGGNASTY